jgi:hypothetical protein
LIVFIRPLEASVGISLISLGCLVLFSWCLVLVDNVAVKSGVGTVAGRLRLTNDAFLDIYGDVAWRFLGCLEFSNNVIDTLLLHLSLPPMEVDGRSPELGGHEQ